MCAVDTLCAVRICSALFSFVRSTALGQEHVVAKTMSIMPTSWIHGLPCKQMCCGFMIFRDHRRHDPNEPISLFSSPLPTLSFASLYKGNAGLREVFTKMRRVRKQTTPDVTRVQRTLCQGTGLVECSACNGFSCNVGPALAHPWFPPASLGPFDDSKRR
jgi:hypothetical protein